MVIKVYVEHEEEVAVITEMLTKLSAMRDRRYARAEVEVKSEQFVPFALPAEPAKSETKRTRTKKAEETLVDPEPETPVEGTPAPAVPPQDAMQSALTALVQRHGVGGVREILKNTFGVERMSAIPEARRAEFVAMVEAS
jgi:hypothetical protein